MNTTHKQQRSHDLRLFNWEHKRAFKGPEFLCSKPLCVSFGSGPRPLIVLPFKAFLTTLQNPGLGLHFLEIPKTDTWKLGEDGL